MRVPALLVLGLIGCKEATPTPTQDSGCVIGFADRDRDGYGNPNLQASSCQEPVVENGDDCDDLFNTAHPGAEEICDGVDNDCDGRIDSEDDEIDLPAQYVDGDGDGVGAGAAVVACQPLPGHVEVGGDCFDNDPSIFPGAPEICDDMDNNCDGDIDDADLDDFDFSSAPSWNIDSDGDGFPGPVVVNACEQPVGAGTMSTDCNDADPNSFPGSEETCNGPDDDCDGIDDFGNSCVAFLGATSGPFELTMTDGVTTYTCTGTVDIELQFFVTPPYQGTYTCTFDGTAGWAAVQTGTIGGTVDEEGEASGTFETLGNEVYTWSGSADLPAFGIGQGLWIDGLTTWNVDADWDAFPNP